jgi:aminobenzoyl-glutamate utilization protein B
MTIAQLSIYIYNVATLLEDSMRALRLALLLMFAATAVTLGQRGGGAPAPPGPSLPPDSAKLTALKTEAVADVDTMKDFIQQGVDQIFSYGELGFQETETSAYLKAILRKNGFAVEEGIAGVPTSFIGSWGSGKPVIALGSDIDCIPQASQKPGVAYHDPIIEGAPGHGEGHNSGQIVNIAAAIAIKKIMEREKMSGTLRIWPGVAEELLGSKAYYVRAGVFKDVDIALFTHVDASFGVAWGEGGGTGLISVLYGFKGESAHAAANPWKGKSALDAVELMDVGWNFRREHLPLSQRSHSVIVDGGDQPNVVPPTASVWYYFRQTTYDGIKELWNIGDQMAKGASERVLGAAWPQHFNRTIAEVTYANIQKVGMPQWSDDDLTLARGIQKELGQRETGLSTRVGPLGTGTPLAQNTGGGSDDIGDVSWAVPTVTLRYPSNIPGLPGHNWANAISMATPIAHKGVMAGAKAQAMTLLDILTKPEVVTAAWDYFRNVQTATQKYTPLLRPDDKPAIELNKATMDKFRPEMRKYYYDSTKYKTYLEQLGIKYPTVRK